MDNLNLTEQQTRVLLLCYSRSDGWIQLQDVTDRFGAGKPNLDSVQASYSRTLKQLTDLELLDHSGRGAGYHITQRGREVASEILRARTQTAQATMI